MKLPGRAWIAIHRTQNRWHDLVAVLCGYCNDTPNTDGFPDGSNGYSFWRCARRRGHSGQHRYRNYVWDNSGRTEYRPVHPSPSQPWDRNATPTMRQARAMGEWTKRQHAKRRAARRARREA